MKAGSWAKGPRANLKRRLMLIKPESNGRSVKVRNGIYAKVEQYRAVTGVPIATVVQTALEDWLDTVGAAQMEALMERSNSDMRKKVVAIDEFSEIIAAVDPLTPNKVIMIDSFNNVN